MAHYVKTEGETILEFPYSFSQLKNDNPTTSFPKSVSDTWLEARSIHKVALQAKPVWDMRTQKVQENDIPTFVEGVWTLGWSVVEKSETEISSYDTKKAIENRERRDGLLAETDWWGASDNNMSQAQTDYRQALRDITTHESWPNLNDDDWPTKP